MLCPITDDQRPTIKTRGDVLPNSQKPPNPRLGVRPMAGRGANREQGGRSKSLLVKEVPGNLAMS